MVCLKVGDYCVIFGDWGFKICDVYGGKDCVGYIWCSIWYFVVWGDGGIGWFVVDDDVDIVLIF